MRHDHRPTTYRASTRCCPHATEAYRLYRKRLREGRQEAALVPGIGTARRLQALAAIGWSRAQLARKLGLSRKRVVQLAENTTGNVHRTTATKVAAVYEQISGMPGGERRTVAAASRHGYAPPAAWDDIDDPTETPKVRHPRHDGDGRILVRRVLAGNADINILTLSEQASLWRQWEQQQREEGRGTRPELFARRHDIGKQRAARIRDIAQQQTPTTAADGRTTERNAA